MQNTTVINTRLSQLASRNRAAGFEVVVMTAMIVAGSALAAVIAIAKLSGVV